MTLEKNKDPLTSVLIIIIIFMILGGFLWWITQCIQHYNDSSDPMIKKIKEVLEPLDPSIKYLKLYKSNKSYTVNKDSIYLCLKDENNNYYPLNHLIYVTLHELAHKFNKKDIGHTPEFHRIFEDLRNKAHELGIYNASIPPLEKYCNY